MFPRGAHIKFLLHFLLLVLTSSDDASAADASTADLVLVKEISFLGDVVEAIQLKENLVLFISWNNQTQKRELWAAATINNGDSDADAPKEAGLGLTLYPLLAPANDPNSSSTTNVEPGWYLNAILKERVVIFQATSAQWGSEPWVSDGTASGTRLMKDLNFAGPLDSRPEGITATKDFVFFTAYRDGVFQGSHSQLWATDGAAENTILLKDGDVSASGIRLLDKSQNKVLFSASYTSALWITDGTINGTRALKSSSSSSSSSGGNSSETTLISCSQYSGTSNDQEPVGGKLYFNCNNEAWVTDGTDRGTFKLLPDIVIRQWGLTGRELALVNGQSFLLAASLNTQSRESTEQQFVYSTTGTTSNTSTDLLLDLSQDPQIVSLYGAFLPDDDGDTNNDESSSSSSSSSSSFLFAVDGQLVKTDGTTSGTSSEGLLDFSPDAKEATSLVLLRLGDRAVIFRAAPETGAFNIYSTTDGTEQGTMLLITLYDTNENNDPEQRHRLVEFHRFSEKNDNGPILLIFESPPFANSTTTNTELVNLEIFVLKQSSFSDRGMGENTTTTASIDVVKIGNLTAAAKSFGYRVLLHSSIVALNDETALLLTTDGESLKISKVTVRPEPPASTTAAIPTSSASSTITCWVACNILVLLFWTLFSCDC